MFDFRLKVFNAVAKRLNFTKASEELFISQPAVTKHIHEIETYYKTQLFERKGSKITLTSAGKILLAHTEELFRIYRKIETDLSVLKEDLKGTIRIGASTTLAQYVLPKHLAHFRQRFPDIKLQLISNNTEQIENALFENKIDLGMVEGQSKRAQLKYTGFLKDEIVLCCRIDNMVVRDETIKLNKLTKMPLLIREHGSGSLEVITNALKNEGISIAELKIEMVLESTESIKSYLLNSDCFAFISINCILDELTSKKIRIIDIQNFSIDRDFYFLRQQGDNNPLTDLLFRFLISDNL